MHKISPNTARTITTLVAATCVCFLTGCKPRQMGVLFSDEQSRKVDPTWVTAVKSCWPALAHEGLSDAALKQDLADPLHFRAAFSPYATYSDPELLLLVSRPVTTAPPPDSSNFSNSTTPILSREQAAAGITPSRTADQSTATETALCTIHPGMPVGFK